MTPREARAPSPQNQLRHMGGLCRPRRFSSVDGCRLDLGKNWPDLAKSAALLPLNMGRLRPNSTNLSLEIDNTCGDFQRVWCLIWDSSSWAGAHCPHSSSFRASLGEVDLRRAQPARASARKRGRGRSRGRASESQHRAALQTLSARAQSASASSPKFGPSARAPCSLSLSPTPSLGGELFVANPRLLPGPLRRRQKLRAGLPLC